jgi:hypothetical protein
MRAPTKTPIQRRRISEAARRRYFHSRIWRRLTAPAPEELKPGAVFRCPGWGRDGSVDYLLVEHPGDSGFAMVVVSGAGAGKIGPVLPKDALIEARGGACVSRSWMIVNWRDRVFEGCAAREVMIADAYPAPR